VTPFTIPLEEPNEPDDDDLAERIKKRGNFSDFCDQLKHPNRKISQEIRNENEDSLSVIIQLPTSGSQQGVNRDSGECIIRLFALILYI
jgi:hypothetical protein